MCTLVLGHEIFSEPQRAIPEEEVRTLEEEEEELVC